MNKEENNKKNTAKTGEHTPHSSKKVHSEYDNSTKDGVKIDSSKKKETE